MDAQVVAGKKGCTRRPISFISSKGWTPSGEIALTSDSPGRGAAAGCPKQESLFWRASEILYSLSRSWSLDCQMDLVKDLPCETSAMTMARAL